MCGPSRGQGAVESSIVLLALSVTAVTGVLCCVHGHCWKPSSLCILQEGAFMPTIWFCLQGLQQCIAPKCCKQM